MLKNVTAVTVSEPVNGSRRRKMPVHHRPKGKTIEHVKVRNEVMQTARKVIRPGQIIKIESATSVLLINEGSK